jgi:tetratricopeptide (TPR) repeat protein
LHGVNILALPLSTVEGFVLSRVDGSTSLEDISIMSGIAPEKVLGILERLSDLGAVRLSWRSGPQARGRSAESAVMPANTAAVAAALAPDAHFRADPPRFGPSELDESADISVETRARILHAYYALEGRNLYQTLGLTRDADRQEIRSAYFELSKLFHPDAYFGRALGGFKPKMEAVFKRLTECYEVLGKPKKRREYDEYLTVTEQARRAQQTMQSIEFTDQEINALREAAERRAAERRVPPAERSSIPSPATSMRPAPAAAAEPAPAQAETRPVPSTPVPSQTERRARVRERMRQRLRPPSSQHVTPSMPAPSMPATPAPAETAEEVDQRRRGLIQGLRNSLRDSASISSSPQALIAGFMAKAKSAESAGDVLLATGQLQLALGVDPNNVQVLAEYDRVSKVVGRNLAANYEKQALYEEKTGNWPAAARSWMRVSDGRPEDASAARRAADATLKASGDLHHAQKYAQKAVALESQSVSNLTTLARVYLAAGLKLNALRELEKAARIAPNDEVVNNLLREAR